MSGVCFKIRFLRWVLLVTTCCLGLSRPLFGAVVLDSSVDQELQVASQDSIYASHSVSIINGMMFIDGRTYTANLLFPGINDRTLLSDDIVWPRPGYLLTFSSNPLITANNFGEVNGFSIPVVTIPEPDLPLLLALGFASLAFLRRRS